MVVLFVVVDVVVDAAILESMALLNDFPRRCMPCTWINLSIFFIHISQFCLFFPFSVSMFDSFSTAQLNNNAVRASIKLSSPSFARALSPSLSRATIKGQLERVYFGGFLMLLLLLLCVHSVCLWRKWAHEEKKTHKSTHDDYME